MNRIYNFALLLVFMLLNISFIQAKEYSINNTFSDSEIKSQIESLSSHIELRYNDEVKAILNTYVSNYRPGTEVILGRANYYFPIIEDIIRKHNLPEEIKYLCVVESGLNPTIKSKAGAVGLWQFMRGTARMFGLTVSNHYDERRDVTLSTEAAMVYLNNLYTKYGDWATAMAAYNCGPGNVNKAISRANSKNYWEIRKYLPKETRRYLPKFVAISYIMTYADQLGLEPNEEKLFTEFSSFASAKIYGKTSLKSISNHCGLSVTEIKKYNPSYFSNSIPNRKEGNTLILPEVHMLTYLSNTNRLHDLVQVFYLKNKTFHLPEIVKQVPQINEVVLPIREVQNTAQIDQIELNLLQQIPVQLDIYPEASITHTELNYRKIRLKKRQSLRDILDADANIDSKIVDAENIQTAGTVTLQK